MAGIAGWPVFLVSLQRRHLLPLNMNHRQGLCRPCEITNVPPVSQDLSCQTLFRFRCAAENHCQWLSFSALRCFCLRWSCVSFTSRALLSASSPPQRRVYRWPSRIPWEPPLQITVIFAPLTPAVPAHPAIGPVEWCRESHSQGSVCRKSGCRV